MEELYSAVRGLLRDRGRALVAIDGPCCAGKSTLGARLAEAFGGSLFHMDDFFLPSALRTAERLDAPGGNVHYERFLDEVLTPLSAGRDVVLRRFDCGRMDFLPGETVPFRAVTVVEGSYSLHPALRAAYDLRVFLDLSPETQRARLLTREGPEGREIFLRRWVPLEERYFGRCGVRACADLVLKGEDL